MIVDLSAISIKLPTCLTKAKLIAVQLVIVYHITNHTLSMIPLIPTLFSLIPTPFLLPILVPPKLKLLQPTQPIRVQLTTKKVHLVSVV